MSNSIANCAIEVWRRELRREHAANASTLRSRAVARGDAEHCALLCGLIWSDVHFMSQTHLQYRHYWAHSSSESERPPEASARAERVYARRELAATNDNERRRRRPTPLAPGEARARRAGRGRRGGCGSLASWSCSSCRRRSTRSRRRDAATVRLARGARWRRWRRSRRYVLFVCT